MSAPTLTPSVPVPSAAVVLLRGVRSSGAASGSPVGSGFEALLVRRNPQLAFHGGAWVFPGGRIDPAEHAAAPEERDAARPAAVRELFEETALQVEPQQLTLLSCWTTPEESPRRFRAWFFMACAPEVGEVRVDGGEIHGHQWFTPEAALASEARREIELPPAVFTTLTLLSRLRQLDAALALATGEPTFYNPRSVFIPEGRVALYQRDAGYEQRALDIPGPRDRLWALNSGMRYERSDHEQG